MIDIISDDELIKSCISGKDKAAWELFVRKYSKVVWSLIYKTFQSYSFKYSDEDAEDLYSIVFLSLVENDFKRIRQFRRDNACTLSTWLSIITVRKTIDYMRKDKSHLSVKSGDDKIDVLDSISDSAPLHDTVLVKEQMAQIVQKAISLLSPKDGMIFDLLYNKGVSPEKTAEKMSMSVSNIYTTKHRIIGKIKQNINDM